MTAPERIEVAAGWALMTSHIFEPSEGCAGCRLADALLEAAESTWTWQGGTLSRLERDKSVFAIEDKAAHVQGTFVHIGANELAHLAVRMSRRDAGGETGHHSERLAGWPSPDDQ